METPNYNWENKLTVDFPWNPAGVIVIMILIGVILYAFWRPFSDARFLARHEADRQKPQDPPVSPPAS